MFMKKRAEKSSPGTSDDVYERKYLCVYPTMLLKNKGVSLHNEWNSGPKKGELKETDCDALV